MRKIFVALITLIFLIISLCSCVGVTENNLYGKYEQFSLETPNSLFHSVKEGCNKWFISIDKNENGGVSFCKEPLLTSFYQSTNGEGVIEDGVLTLIFESGYNDVFLIKNNFLITVDGYKEIIAVDGQLPSENHPTQCYITVNDQYGIYGNWFIELFSDGHCEIETDDDPTGSYIYNDFPYYYEGTYTVKDGVFLLNLTYASGGYSYDEIEISHKCAFYIEGNTLYGDVYEKV